MVEYLKIVKSALLNDEENRRQLAGEIDTYIRKYRKARQTIQANPMHTNSTGEINTHSFVFPTGEEISISWDIGQIRSDIKNNSIQYLALPRLKEIIQADLAASIDEFIDIGNEVVSVKHHLDEPLIVMDFKPQRSYLLIDGRHRFVEYAKFNQKSLIPCYFIDSEDCCKNIILKRDLIIYKILKNIWVVKRYMEGESCLAELEDITLF